MYLNCHSWFSLRYGVMSEEKLLEEAAANHVTRLVLTDINSTAAAMNYIRLCQKQNVRPVVGVDFRNGVEQQFIGIARNNEGFRELNEFLSTHLEAQKPFGDRSPCFRNVSVVYPMEKIIQGGWEDLTDDEYIGISIADLRKLPFSRCRDFKEKLVILQHVTFRNKVDFNLHRLMRAIDNNILLSQLPKLEEASPDAVFYPMENLASAFSEFPFILANTENLLNACHISFWFRDPKKSIDDDQSLNLRSVSGSLEKDASELERLCRANLRKRYPDSQKDALARLEKELGLINKMKFVSYFLINHKIIEYAKKKGYFYVGRGSGANSIVAYLLEITDVDPIELDLYFERFINLFRTTPPDFDIDFSWRDREDITRFIFETFDNVALVGTYVTYNYRGAIRELGKVMGLPKEKIDLLPEEGLNPKSDEQELRIIAQYGRRMKDIPNYISVHSSGILISQEPIHNYSATFLPPKGFRVSQLDMYISEDAGLYKFDILAQRGLGKIKETLEIVAYNQPKAVIDIHDLPSFKKDEKINQLLAKGQCMGAFYIESPAMRMLLSKLEVDNYLGLVAASSIIRPGVSKSGMMREYLLRHRDPERMKMAHPVMLEIMQDTYGVMVYQEDVIKVAHYFAGLTLGEADVLRRGMSGKYRSREEFQQVEEKFFTNCRQRGYPEKTISEVWMQIESFAGYAFAKGHSASYAVESYQSLFLKAYYPLEFMTAVLNNGGGFYSTETYIHEARMSGARIHAPCINNSQAETVISGIDIYLGLAYLRQLEERVIFRILNERKRRGPFDSLDDFVERLPIGIEQISILIRIGAFRFTDIDKYELLWQAHFKLGHITTFDHQHSLFRIQHRKFDIPELKTTFLEAAFDQMELLGFPLCSPFRLLKDPPENQRGARDFPLMVNRNIDICGSLVTVKRTRTHKGDEMNFATFIDCHGSVFDAVLFPQVADAYRFRGLGIYRLFGKVVDEFGFLSIEVIKMKKEEFVADPRHDK